jgi:hypothetical protein
VAATVRVIAARYPALDGHLTRQRIGNGIRATYGVASLAMAAREGRGEGA